MKLKTLLLAVLSLIATTMSAQTKTAYAVYCAGSNAENDPASLYFLAAETAPTGTYNGQTITEVWSGVAVTSSDSYYTPDWNSNTKNITRVVFEESFKDVKPNSCCYWFYNCAKLATIEGIANLNTASVTNMSHMFYGCKALATLDLSSFTTGNVTNMSYMFYGCKALTTLDLSSFTTGNVTYMAQMFYGCSALESLVLGDNFTTEKVTDMMFMFYGCSALKALNLSIFNTGEVMNMTSMFDGCSALKSLNLSSFTTGNVESMMSMFNGCSALESLTLGNNFTTEKVTDMNRMFAGCSALTTLDLSSFKTGEVTKMNSMFDGCRALTTLNLSSFNTEKVENMTFMFKGCSALKALDLSNFRTSKLEYYDNIFAGCNSLLSLDMREAGLGGLMAATNSDFAKRGMVFYLSDVASTSGDAFDENYVVKFGSGGSTSFTRTFTGGKISTVCLPFAANADNNDGTFYEFKDCNDGKTVKFTKLTSGYTEANKAYLFKPNETAGDVRVIFNTYIKAIDGLPEMTEGDENGLYGVYTKKEFTPEEADRNIYYGWSAGNFVSIGAGATLNPGRAYLKVTAPQGGNAKDILKAIFDDETTGISEVNAPDCDDNAPAYDLMGRRVGAGYKGIVIKNGKKVKPHPASPKGR